jgi:acetylornithine deacetylase/succinyl-diaminopimelate desuccinylase-like protein
VKEVTGKKLVVKGMGGATDARFFANVLGIPTINFGPGRFGEGNAHAVNENLRITDLILAAKVCALSALDLAAHGPK